MISLEEKITFTKHLSVMLKSGIPIADAFDTAASQTSNTEFKKKLIEIHKNILNGDSLAKSLSRAPNVFNSFYIYMIKIGEDSGTLDQNLRYLAEQLKKDADFRKKVTSASLYPMIVILTAFGVGMGISFFVLPKLIDLFESLDVKLPLSTRLLIGFANVTKNYGVLIVIGIILLGIIFRLLLQVKSIRHFYQKLILHLPVFGRFSQNVEMTLFCRNLGMMLKSGLPILKAIQTQKMASENLIFKDYLTDLERGIEMGKSLSETLKSKKFPFFSDIATRMIAVGEKTGNLDESLLYLANFFEEEVDGASKNLTSVLEPIMLLIVGILVAFMALAIISPIYQFTGSVKR